VIWAATDLLGDIYLWSAAIRELRRRGLLKGIRPSLRSHGLDGGWRFAFTINLTASVNSAWGPVARLLVGGFSALPATGLYRVATIMIDAVQSPIDLMAKAVHPELMRHDPATSRPWRLMLRTMALGTLVALFAGLVIGIFGREAAGASVRPEFRPAAPLLMVLLILPVIATLAFPLPAMFYSLGRPSGPLVANVVGALVFIGSLPILAPPYGLVGAGAALVLGRLCSLLVMAALLTSLYRQRPATNQGRGGSGRRARLGDNHAQDPRSRPRPRAQAQAVRLVRSVRPRRTVERGRAPRPRHGRRLCAGKLQPRVTEAYLNESFDREILREMGQLGLLGATIPQLMAAPGSATSATA
jgi:hypothetical protein